MKLLGLVALVACGGHHDPAGVDAATPAPPDASVIGRACDPINDNDFDGPGPLTKTGTACGDDPTIGCYPTMVAGAATTYSCQKSDNPDARSGAMVAHGRCAPGYINGLFYADDSGQQLTECIAMCAPGDAYVGASPEQPNGVPGHGCNDTDEAGTFGAIPDGSATSNGVHCMYMWMMEIDDVNVFHGEPYSNKVGLCVDHTKYHYDSNGDGRVDSSDAVWPACAGLPERGSQTGVTHTYGADDFGCISSTEAGLQ